MTHLDWLNELEVQLEKILSIVKEAQVEELKETPLTCRFCTAQEKVRNLTYIQTHWYVEPYSCTGGDYWKESEGQYECPSCGKRNRDIFEEEIKKLKRYFKEKIDEFK